jgi:hypothetical protein
LEKLLDGKGIEASKFYLLSQLENIKDDLMINVVFTLPNIYTWFLWAVYGYFL